MSFTMTTSNPTIIARMRQCGGAHRQQAVLAAAALKTRYKLTPEMLGVPRFNVPAGTFEVDVRVKEPYNEEFTSMVSEAFFSQLDSELTPVAPSAYGSTWRTRA